MTATPRAGKLRKAPCWHPRSHSQHVGLDPSTTHFSHYALLPLVLTQPSPRSAPLSRRSQVSRGPLLSLHEPPTPTPPQLLSEPERWMPRPSPRVPHLHQPQLDRPQLSIRDWGIWQISQDCPSLWSVSGVKKGCGWGSFRPHSCDQENLTSCIQWQP